MLDSQFVHELVWEIFLSQTSFQKRRISCKDFVQKLANALNLALRPVEIFLQSFCKGVLRLTSELVPVGCYRYFLWFVRIQIFVEKKNLNDLVHNYIVVHRGIYQHSQSLKKVKGIRDAQVESHLLQYLFLHLNYLVFSHRALNSSQEIVDREIEGLEVLWGQMVCTDENVRNVQLVNLVREGHFIKEINC